MITQLFQIKRTPDRFWSLSIFKAKGNHEGQALSGGGGRTPNTGGADCPVGLCGPNAAQTLGLAQKPTCCVGQGSMPLGQRNHFEGGKEASISDIYQTHHVSFPSQSHL